MICVHTTKEFSFKEALVPAPFQRSKCIFVHVCIMGQQNGILTELTTVPLALRSMFRPNASSSSQPNCKITADSEVDDITHPSNCLFSFKISRHNAVLHLWPAKPSHYPMVEIFPPALSSLPKAVINNISLMLLPMLPKPCWRRRWWCVRCKLGLWTQQEV